MRSMTGFGQAAAENERLRVNVILRGVNHRFLDLALRLREEWRGIETDLRDRLSARLHRGRVEVGFDVESLAPRAVEIKIDEPAVTALHAHWCQLRDRGLIDGGLRMNDLLRLQDVVRLESRAPDWQDEDMTLIFRVVDKALDQLIDARDVEGQKLKEALEQRLNGLAILNEQLRDRAAELPAEMAESLRQRIEELAATPDLEPNRLAQEVALLVDRSDVSEEIDRLASHLEHFRSIVRQPGSLGKRLDFLAQEVFRELNTIGTKCRDSEMTRWVLDGKVLCEQLREQIQNVE